MLVGLLTWRSLWLLPGDCWKLSSTQVSTRKNHWRRRCWLGACGDGCVWRCWCPCWQRFLPSSPLISKINSQRRLKKFLLLSLDHSSCLCLHPATPPLRELYRYAAEMLSKSMSPFCVCVSWLDRSSWSSQLLSSFSMLLRMWKRHLICPNWFCGWRSTRRSAGLLIWSTQSTFVAHLSQMI